eukprot:Tamp_22890.p1 GENE.Tamp_22890~~Tamp_22890.p1  ORF type:complete len:234 (+),score=59.35 Tamp_22890:36-737(+)
MLSLKQSEGKVCSFWFHTSFVQGDELVLKKADLDGPPKKDKKGDKFRDSFGVSIAMQDTESKDIRIHHPDSGISGTYTPSDIMFDKAENTFVLPCVLPSGGRRDGGGGEFIRLASRESNEAHEDSGDAGQRNKANSPGARGKQESPTVFAKSSSDVSLGEQMDVVGEAVMLYDFDPSRQHDNQPDLDLLRLRCNDIVTILRKEPDGWWLGMSGDEVGWFPEKFCVEIQEQQDE